eukprot:g3279.t1
MTSTETKEIDLVPTEIRVAPMSPLLEKDHMNSTNHDIEAQAVDQEERQESKKGSSCGKIVLYAIAIVPMFVLHLLLIITFFFQMGNGGVGGWHLNAFLSITIVLIFVFSLSFACRSKIENSSKIKKKFSIVFMVWGITLILLNEIALGVVVPTSSVLPLETFDNHDTLKTSADLTEACTQDLIEARWNAVKEYYNQSKVDFTNVRLVTGGMPGHFNTAGAMVIDETIYLTKNSCPSIDLLVHEVVHVWQFQTSWWFGSNGASRFFDWQIGQIKCRSCPYDYGGEEGLEEYYARGVTNIRSLGPEQQAEIVQDFYLSSAPSTVMRFYAEQVLIHS